MKFNSYGIIMPDGADSTISYAVEELAHFIKETSGIDCLAVYESEGVKFNKTFYVGETKKGLEIGIPDEKSLNYYGFIIKTVGDSMIIAGANSRATLYGVYEYVESVLGVRFLTKEKTYVPTDIEEIFPDIDKVEVPDFRLRSYLFEDAIKSPVFSARKRFNTLHCEDSVKCGGSIDADFLDERHNTLDIVQPKHWFKTHPQMFNTKDGKVVDICWTNGIKEDGTLDESLPVSTVKIIIEGLKNRIRYNPRAKYFMVGQFDATYGYCTCDECKRVIEKYGSPSACIIRAMNVVTEVVTKWANSIGREVHIATFAYAYSEKPPVKYDSNDNPYVVDSSVICHPNLYVRLAPMSQDTIYPAYDERQGEFVKNLKGWKLVANKYMIWEYTNCFPESLWYFPAWLNIKENCKFYKELGVEYVMYQGQLWEAVSFTEHIKSYVASKVLWNANVDVNALIDEFITLYYGKNADVVKRVVEMFDAKIKANVESGMKDCGVHMLLHNYGVEQRPEVFPREFLESVLKVIDDRIEMLDGSEKRQLEYVSLVPLKMLLFNDKTFYTYDEARIVAKKFCDRIEKFGYTEVNEGRSGVIPETGVEYGVSAPEYKARYDL